MYFAFKYFLFSYEETRIINITLRNIERNRCIYRSDKFILSILNVVNVHKIVRIVLVLAQHAEAKK